MSALSKLSVGQDAGTSRPATAQQPKPATHSKQQLEQQPHPLLQSLGFQGPHAAFLPGYWDAAVQESLLSTNAARRGQQRPNCAAGRPWTACKASACRQQQPPARKQVHTKQQQQQLSSTLSEVLAEVSAAPQPASKAPPLAQSSRPVTPHATKPYKSVPALSTILQHNSSNRPTTAAGRLLTPSNAYSTCHSSVQAPLHAQNSNRAGWVGTRPGTASSAYLHAAHCSRLQQAAPSTAGSLRPGSAAAAKILRAIDKACVATPRPGGRHTAVQKQSGPGSSDCGSSSLCRAQQQQQQQQQPEWSQMQAAERNHAQAASALSSCHDTQLAQDSGSSSTSADDAARTAATAAAAADSRPATAAVWSVLATAGAPDDGVEARLAAIRAKNSTFDQSADLDIVYEEGLAEALADVLAEECQEGCSSEVLTQLQRLGPVLAAACALGGVVGGLVCGEGAVVAAVGVQQAAAMVLSLDDWSACTPEVLEMELESLDVEQLTQLKHLLLDA